MYRTFFSAYFGINYFFPFKFHRKIPYLDPTFWVRKILTNSHRHLDMFKDNFLSPHFMEKNYLYYAHALDLLCSQSTIKSLTILKFRTIEYFLWPFIAQLFWKISKENGILKLCLLVTLNVHSLKIVYEWMM